MRLSIIILNWNGAEMLRKYLPSVIKYSTMEDCEIVVADNGSTDDSMAVLNEFQNAIRIILFETNFGFAEGYNRAIQQTAADYVVLLNSDVEVTEGWLQPIMNYFEQHQEVVAIQPKILADTNRQYFEYAGAAGGFLDAFGYPYCRGRILDTIEEDRGQYDTIIPIFWASGACLFIQREAYLKAGGLDADFFAHQEEIDLCWRLNCRGGKIVCIPQSVVYHLGGGTLNYDSPRKTFLNFKNNLLMLYKNLPIYHLGYVMIVRFFLDYLSALHLLIIGKHKNARAVIKARWATWKALPKFSKKRENNLNAMTIAYPKTIAQYAMIFAYYFLGRKTYQQVQ